MTAPGEQLPVLVAAAGAPWEPEALDLLTRARGLAVHKRCVDLHDLVASAGTGLARVALVAAELPGLDADSMTALGRQRVATVVVCGPGAGVPPERLRRLGVRQVVGPDLEGLAATLRSAAAEAWNPDGAGPGTAPPGQRRQPGPPGQPSMMAPNELGAEPPVGRLVAVWGPMGSPGRTTVATGVAAESAARGRATFLLDVDPYGGAVAQHLGVLDEASGLLAAARLANAGELDPDRLSGLARSVGAGLRVLTGLPRPDRWQEVRAAPFEELLHSARRLDDVVVLDLGFSLEQGSADPFSGAPGRNQMTLAGLHAADAVVVVGAADPVGLSRLARGLVELGEVLPAVTPHVVVNHIRPTLGWSEREIHGMVEGFVRPASVSFLPEDRAAADRALMAGRSLVETGDSALRGGLAALADAVLGTDPSPQRARRGLRRRRAGRAR